jgi:catechol 2,3-dioxygenase-like lactoylglutathione lyase family enzyme
MHATRAGAHARHTEVCILESPSKLTTPYARFVPAAAGREWLGYTATMFAIDHLAFPCFDLDATLRFYTDVLGAALRHAQSGSAQAWNAEEYLLVALELPGGVMVDFFAVDGMRRPPDDGLPKDIRHVALAVATRGELIELRERLTKAALPFWTETHDVDDLHVYTTDPNGVTLEIVASTDSVRSRPHDTAGASSVVERWLARRGGGLRTS